MAEIARQTGYNYRTVEKYAHKDDWTEDIFEHIGGVPTRLRFDNMSTAVAQIGKGAERVLTDGFTRFMLHHRFQADFCNPASGNEKGNVENKVGKH